jgi:ubiquinone/menaquinone biosynthesis C-methylase UbiE
MYSSSAIYYDLIYEFKDYKEESANISALIESVNPGAKTILDIACGTGEHDKFLKNKYDVQGIDLDEIFIGIARNKNPQCVYHHCDMSDFKLANRFDAIICLFSSIGYLKNINKISQSIACFKRHLNPGGVILVEPWFEPEVYLPDTAHMTTVDKEDVKICRSCVSRKTGNLSSMNMHYLITSSKGVEYFEELHELGLFTPKEMISAFELAGCQVDYQPLGLTGRGLYIAQSIDKL